MIRGQDKENISQHGQGYLQSSKCSGDNIKDWAHDFARNQKVSTQQKKHPSSDRQLISRICKIEDQENHNPMG